MGEGAVLPAGGSAQGAPKSGASGESGIGSPGEGLDSPKIHTRGQAGGGLTGNEEQASFR